MLSGRRLTLLIIPEEGGRTFEFKIPRILLWVAAGIVFGFVVLLGIGLRAWIDAAYLTRQVERLERDKAILSEEVALIDELEVMLRELESSGRQLRSITAEAVGLRSRRTAERGARSREQFISITDRLRYGSLWTVPTMAPVRVRSWKRFGEGVLLPVPRGSLVRAAAAGRVTTSRYVRGVGITLLIDHGNGLQTRYGGIATPVVEAGAYVQKGQPLGLTSQPHDGSTPGLRFAIIEDGRECTTDYQRIWM